MTPFYLALDHAAFKSTKAGRRRTYLACNLYLIREVRPSLVQALIDFLKPWEDTSPSPEGTNSSPSLTDMMFPEQRTYLFHELTKTVLSHVDFHLDYEFGKVEIANDSLPLSKFLNAQNNRREKATIVHPDQLTLTPLNLPYHLDLPQPTIEAFLRLTTAPIYHVTLPTLDVNSRLQPFAVYSYDPTILREMFNYTNLVDWQVWEKPSDFRALRKFRERFDPDRSHRLRSSPDLERMVLSQSWVTQYANGRGLQAHPKLVIDHGLHVPEIAEELLLLQKGFQMPMNKRVDWDELDQHAAQAYPDYRRNPDYYKVSEPKFLQDVWGTTYSIKVKILLFRPENPSPLEGVRTNKDGAIESLRGLKNPFNLAEIRGDFVFAMKVTLVPSHLVADEQTQTLIQQPKRQRGRPKVLKDKPHRPRPTQKPKTRTQKTKEEVDTTPI